MKKKVWLITGCSSGFGKAIASAAIKAGYAVVVTARNIFSLREFAVFDPSSVLILTLDVTSFESIHAAIAAAIGKFGRIDVLVNNAGYGYYELFEQVNMGKFRAEMEVNLFGAIEMCRAVLPYMRARRSGRIINISSIAGSVGTQGRTAYSASKFALTGVSECLAAEVSPFGIYVTVVEPPVPANKRKSRRRS